MKKRNFRTVVKRCERERERNGMIYKEDEKNQNEGKHGERKEKS